MDTTTKWFNDSLNLSKNDGPTVHFSEITEPTNTEGSDNTEKTGTNTEEQKNKDIEGAIEKGKEQKENAILKSWFKQQGMSEDEINEAVKAWKDAKAQKAAEEAEAKAKADAQKDEAVKNAEAERDKALEMLKTEKINNAIQSIAVSLGADPKRLSLITKLADLSNVTISDTYEVDNETVKTAITKVLEEVPEFKLKAETQANNMVKFGAAPNNTEQVKPAKNLSLRESLALKYN